VSGARLDEVTIPPFDDPHVHFREDASLPVTAAACGRACGGAMAMPNTVKPIRDARQAIDYAAAIAEAGRGHFRAGFSVRPTIMLTPLTTRRTIADCVAAGVRSAKLYPRGATTNSEYGVPRPDDASMLRVYEAMERLGMVLHLHMEDPEVSIMTREQAYISTFDEIVNRFPGLKVVVEHVTTVSVVAWIQHAREGVAGTITAHHLLCTIDDVLGVQGLRDQFLPDGGPRLDDGRGAPGLRPHYYCLPVPKYPADRRALISVATSGSDKFYFGSDTALHPESRKVCECGCAGVFVPGDVALGVLAWVFDTCGPPDWPDMLARFACRNGATFLGLPPHEGTVTLRRRDWIVPTAIVAGDVHHVPLAAGHILPWEPVT
jgi:dihydroorotase